MSFHAFTTQEKLAVVDSLIAANKHGQTADALRAIAADLRGRLGHAPSVALLELERRMTAVDRRPRSVNQARVAAQVGVAEELAGRWPVVKQALERFGAEIEAGDGK